ncbi:MAG: hypothetical protein J7641_20575 [Cyanobacteria bacterium SID2]|nr:hypothetical protein [Cyanobacteria bacterium SID2]
MRQYLQIPLAIAFKTRCEVRSPEFKGFRSRESLNLTFTDLRSSLSIVKSTSSVRSARPSSEILASIEIGRNPENRDRSMQHDN